MCLQFVKELDASTSEISELESKLSAAQRRIQNQAEEQEEAESARAQQGQQLNALAQDMQALQSSLERVKQDRQQVCLCILPCRTIRSTPQTRPSDASFVCTCCVLSDPALFQMHRDARTAETMLGVYLHQLDPSPAFVALRCSDVLQASEEAGQAKARLGVCERELSLARQEVEGSSRSGQALSTELHTLSRQNAALQHQVASVQAQLEETLDGRQAEVGLGFSRTAQHMRADTSWQQHQPFLQCCAAA